ncbi:VOC family protein [Haloplanus rubicundus]|uniref:VOC family protein n=1 Tax=Haloplanus rubicundus TaxID=1547898 RepID=A0A345EBK3_9EURY|nr:VOC family protein [Haloplanus rubicundus]AXG09575.1 VOC family protein [Haloplanus rubicundus]
MTDKPTPTGIDHFVLTVENVERTCEFYETLGAEVVTFGDDRTAVQFGDQKINLHPADHRVAAYVAETPAPGSGDFCIVTETPIEAVLDHLDEEGIDVVTGPVERAGAVGTLTSVYVRDPDGNLVELGTYGE